MEVRQVALMVSDFEDGGVERNFTHLASGLARLGIRAWLLAGQTRHPYLEDLDPAVRVAPIFGGRVPFLRDFVIRERPDLLLTGKLADDFAAVSAKSELGARWPAQTRLVAAVGTLLSGRLDTQRWNLLKTWREVRRIRACYERLDGITAISVGVAEDLRRVFGIEGVPIAVLNNPILPEGYRKLAQAPCPHAWLAGVIPERPWEERPAVVLAIGGLRKVKDFATLLRAFARVEDAQARLLILGGGKEGAHLTRLGRRLGLGDRLDLPGFVPSPYPYLARGRLLVLQLGSGGPGECGGGGPGSRHAGGRHRLLRRPAGTLRRAGAGPPGPGRRRRRPGASHRPGAQPATGSGGPDDRRRALWPLAGGPGPPGLLP